VAASSGSQSPSRAEEHDRREFPALKFVAKTTDVISWLYIIGGILGGIAVMGSGGQQAMPASLVAGLAVAAIALIVAVFIRAFAEMIRLALYIATLLEDIRSKAT